MFLAFIKSFNLINGSDFVVSLLVCTWSLRPNFENHEKVDINDCNVSDLRITFSVF